MVDYFQIKYLINDCFYYEIYVNDRSYDQAASICYEAFWEYINGEEMTSAVSKSTIIMLKYRHKVKISANDIVSMRYIVEKSKVWNKEKFLNKESMEFVFEEIEFINERLKEIDSN